MAVEVAIKQVLEVQVVEVVMMLHEQAEQAQ